MAGINDLSRKRLRSVSGSSNASGASSPKRALSDSPGPNSFVITNTMSDSQAGADTQVEIDEYMMVQEEDISLEKIDLSPPPTSPLPASSPKPSPKEKLALIKQLQSRPLNTGDTWYVVSRPWFERFMAVCGGPPTKDAPQDESMLGPVDNTPIVGSKPTRLSVDRVVEGEHIEFIPQEAWDSLVSWYGEPTHAFPRMVIEEGVSKTKRIELFPVTFYLSRLAPANPSPSTSVTFSRSATVSDLHDYLEKELKLGPNAEYRVWSIGSDSSTRDQSLGCTPHTLVSHQANLFYASASLSEFAAGATLEEVSDGDHLVVEEKGAHGQWFLRPVGRNQQAILASSFPSSTLRNQNAPSPPDDNPPPLFGEREDFFSQKYPSRSGFNSNRDTSRNSGWMSSGGYGSTGMNRVSYPPKPRGTIGLVNLGNTCFMNSALQCLAHLPELTNYFLSGVYEEELNPDNPLSTGGELARSYGKLMHALYPEEGFGTASVAPREFKVKIAHHAPSFSGYAQHDTQELLAFLLDGLHEDLNRVKKKPYVENPDWEGGGLPEVMKLAQVFWDGYKKRNDSVIVDLFQGQYKSTLVCPECQKVSITFDPFMYLTLPIPVTKRWKHEMFFVTWDMNKPNYKTVVDMPYTATFRDVKVLFAKWFNSDPDYIFSAEIFQFRFYKLIHDHTPVNEFNQHDQLFFYELPVKSGQAPTAQPSPTDPFVCPVYTVSPTRFAQQSYRNTRLTNRDTWGYPFFVLFNQGDDDAERFIYRALVDRYRQATRQPDRLYTWKEQTSDEAGGSSDGGAPTKSESEPPASTEQEEEEMELVAGAGVNGKAEDSQTQDAPAGTQPLVNGGPQEGLFTWTAREANFNTRDGRGAAWDTGHPADMRERTEEAIANDQANEDDMKGDHTPEEKAKMIKRPTGLLRPGDGIVCEWDHNLQEFYFGERGMGKESRWNETETYTDPEQAAALLARQGKEKKALTVEDCLDEFVKEEKLGEDDLWYCPRCKEHRQATKKLEIWKVPDILVVHLKRFSNSRSLRDKIEALVEFPIEGLDLSERVGQASALRELSGKDAPSSAPETVEGPNSLLYDLFAVDEHMGGLGGGHYRAYAKNPDDGLWYHYDDSHVTKTSAQQSVTPYAYLLFYRRRTNEVIGGPTVEKTEAAKKNTANNTANNTPPEDNPAETQEPEEVIMTAEQTTTPFPMSMIRSISMEDLRDDGLQMLSASQRGSPASSNGVAAPASPTSDSPWSQNGEWTPADRSTSLEMEEPFGWSSSGFPISSEGVDITLRADDPPVDEIEADSISDILVRQAQAKPSNERFDIDQ